MRLAFHAQTWGRLAGHPAGVGNIKELYYRSSINLCEAVKGIATAGYEGVEAFDGDLMPYYEPKERKVLAEVLGQVGVRLVAVYCAANYIFPEVFEEEKYKINRAVELAASLGCEILVVGGGAVRHDGIRETDYAQMAKGLDAIVDIALSAGLKSCYHPHMRSLAQHRTELKRIMNLSKINLCPDTGHLLAARSDCLEVFETYAERINYVHFKDYKQEQWSDLGRGEVEFTGLIGCLKRANYQGWITVEEETAGHEEHPLQTAVAAKEYMDKILS